MQPNPLEFELWGWVDLEGEGPDLSSQDTPKPLGAAKPKESNPEPARAPQHRAPGQTVSLHITPGSGVCSTRPSPAPPPGCAHCTRGPPSLAPALLSRPHRSSPCTRTPGGSRSPFYPDAPLSGASMPLGPAGKRPVGLRLCSPRGRAARNGATRPPPRSRTAPRNAAAPGPGREFELKGPPPPSWPPACG